MTYFEAIEAFDELMDKACNDLSLKQYSQLLDYAAERVQEFKEGME